MIKRKVTVNNGHGIHARPASLITKSATKYKSKVEMIFGTKKIDCKSVIGILSLGAKGGTELLLQADGPDAEAAVREIGQLFDNNFGE